MPLYDDKTIKSLDEKLQKNVAAWQNMPKEEKEALREEINKLHELLKDKDMTSFAEGIDEETRDKLKEFVVLLETFQATLFENLFSQSIEVMNALKEAAENGNEEAKKAYEKMNATLNNTLHPEEDQKN
jgi:hypothetical protein